MPCTLSLAITWTDMLRNLHPVSYRMQAMCDAGARLLRRNVSGHLLPLISVFLDSRTDLWVQRRVICNGAQPGMQHALHT